MNLILKKIHAFYLYEFKTFLITPHLLIKRIYYFLSGKWFMRITKNRISFHEDIPIDIIIPSIEKDYDILPYCLWAAKKYVMHPIRQIHIIAPESGKILQICKDNNCNFINENSLLPVKKTDIKYNVNGFDRSGWLFQQLIKLNSDSISTADNFLILDSDTILINPMQFHSGKKFILYFSDDYHIPYTRAYYSIFKKKMRCPVSFVTHFMLFNKKRIIEFKNEIEKFNHNERYKAIMDSTVYTVPAGFSEYESYGNYLYEHHPDELIIRYWFNKSINCAERNEIPKLSEKYKKGYLNLSFHIFTDGII